MKRSISTRRILGVCSGLAIFVVFWTFDPNVWRVRSRFPTAVIKDWSQWGWLLPGFMHSWSGPHDLYEGRYLDIEIAGRDVDLTKLADIPFVILDLDRCKVTGLENLNLMGIGDTQSISLHDCDVTENPPSVLRDIPDPRHATNEIGGP